MGLFKSKPLAEIINVQEYMTEGEQITALLKSMTSVKTSYDKYQKQLNSLQIERESLQNSLDDFTPEVMAQNGIDGMLTKISNFMTKQKKTTVPEIELQESILNSWWQEFSQKKLIDLNEEIQPLLDTVQANLEELVAEYETAKNSAELVTALMPLLDQIEPLVEKYSELSRLTTAKTVSLKTPELLTLDMRANKIAEKARASEAQWYINQIEVDKAAHERGQKGHLF